jgi:polar amino acid transport system substrate-binding protein
MTISRGFKSVALGAALALSLAACGSSGGETKSGVPLIKSGTLTVCSDVPYPPFEDFDKSSPTGFKGFDVDIVSRIAKKLGVKLKIKDSDFNGLQSGLSLNSGDCDMAASAMTITPERAKKIGFSDGYYDSKQSLLVPVDSPIKSIDDLAGKQVGVQKGTTGEAYTKEHAPKAKAIQYPSDGEMFQAIKAGNVDALLQDLPVNLDHTKDGKFKIVEQYDTQESYGLAMKKTNTKLIAEVNKILGDLKDSGDYQKIYDKYFKAS